jgi:spermidine synthase
VTVVCVLLVTVLTGFTGLVYEVSWERYLATLLGSHSEATAAVLGLFLGGLSVGYAWFGAVARRAVESGERAANEAHLLRIYGLVEIGIGLHAFLFPWIFDGIRAVSVALPVAADGLLSFAIDVGLCAILIGPPTVLMGGTIPLLTQALAGSVTRATRFHALVYGCNTLGAFAGALGAAFILVPRFGLPGVVGAMGVLNVLAGSALVGLSRRPFTAMPTGEEAEPVAAARAPASFLGVAFLVGFAMMTLQAMVIRVGGLSLGASPNTFAVVVSIFVLGIGAGSLAVGALPRVPRGALGTVLTLLVFWLMALYPALERAPYGAHLLRILLRSDAAAFGLFNLLVLMAGLMLVGPAAALSGATLPLLFHSLRGRFGLLGQAAGSLYSWNTLGSLFGALLGGYALLFWLDLHQVYRIALAGLVVAAVLGCFLEGSRRAGIVAAAVGVLALVTIVALPAWLPEALTLGLYRKREPTTESYDGIDAMVAASGARNIFHEDDPIATITVVEREVEGQLDRALIINGKSDSNTTADYPTMCLAALIPAVLTEPLQSAFVIGLGTGVTAGELASLEGIDRVVVAEISPAVVNAAPLFDFASLGASQHAKVELIRSDAYRALSRSEQVFDLIVSEPSNPWVAGVEMLFTHEFYAAAKQRLSSHGLFVQWIHEYASDDATLALVLRTFRSEFRTAAIWYGNGPDLILVGMGPNTPEPSVASVARRAQRPDIAAGLRRAGIRGPLELFAHELLPTGVLRQIPMEGPLHGLYRPRLNTAAARAFFVGASAQLPFSGLGPTARLGAERSLFAQLRRQRAEGGGALRETEWAAFASEVCDHRTRECVATLASWSHAQPDSQHPHQLATQRHQASGGGFPAESVRPLTRLFDAPAGAPAATTPAQLRQAARLFAVFYFHAVPFQPGRLLELRRGCVAPESAPGSCATAWGEARALLRGGFEE